MAIFLSEWKKCAIGDLCDTISETYKKGHDKVVLINTSDVLEGKVLNNTHVENKQLKGQFKKTFKKDDILYSEIRPANRRYAFIDFENTEDYIASTKLMVLRPRKDVVLPEFLYLMLTSQTIIDELQHLAETRSGTFPQITFSSELATMPIMLPPFKIQKKITSVISVLDGKIELNNRINENLEQQAQALFKAWFVDFEPFGGAMPDDWTEITLGTIAAISTKSINPLKQPDLYLEHYSIPAYDEQHYPVFEYASEVKSNKYILTNNSVMISKLNPDTKRIWRPLCLSANPVCSTEFIVYEAVNPKYKDYIYSLIDSQAFSDYLCAHTTGSTNSRQRATPKTTLDYTCIMPSDDIITRFCGIVTPMYDQIASNIIESQRLAALRDTLLPKLMNGEIDVSAVQI